MPKLRKVGVSANDQHPADALQPAFAAKLPLSLCFKVVATNLHEPDPCVSRPKHVWPDNPTCRFRLLTGGALTGMRMGALAGNVASEEVASLFQTRGAARTRAVFGRHTALESMAA